MLIGLLVGAYDIGAQSVFNDRPAGYELKGLDFADDAAGVVYTHETVFRTDDGGKSWRELAVPKLAAETVAHAAIASDGTGHVLLSNITMARLEIVRTGDGGETWTRQSIAIPADMLERTDLARATLSYSEVSREWHLRLRLQTSSNFTGWMDFASDDGGLTWRLQSEWVAMDRPDDAAARADSLRYAGSWTLRTEGFCAGFKTGCMQETRLYKAGREGTPEVIRERIDREKSRLRTETAATPPPGGSTRISLNRGFDKCTAAPASQMRTWWETSPHYDANIYMSGRNRGCAQPQLTAAWVAEVSAMGWGLIPTVVGYQAPCSVSTNSSKHSSDPATARTQGRGEADIAVADAITLGLTAGSVLYYDMERYDDLSGTGACSTPVKAFLEGWTERIHELGFKSGVYGSPTNAVGDWLSIPIAHRMDAIWMARWDNNPTVWSYASPSPAIPTNAWNNHQRIKQWQAPHNETWGGVTFNIDGNIADGPVAGPAIAKNKNADFDGDGKSDISVFRPDSGTWFVLSSVTSTFSALPFGEATDIIAPGDYDGDGKTDYAVFRPSTGIWHMSLKARAYSARQWGADGDIPAPADYNGDGKTDLAVFRPSNGTWYIANSDSLATMSFVQFGQIGDRPVPGDYDGDGKTDLAVYRPAGGFWYALRSSDGAFSGTAFGITSDRPAQGDYDGDGKTDLAVYRDGIWYLQQSTAGFSGFQFGVASDLPSPGDFDGDGKTDMAVYRPADGVWYQQLSGSGFSGTGFGLAADRPVPSAYLPR
jgi:hypothetical protein